MSVRFSPSPGDRNFTLQAPSHKGDNPRVRAPNCQWLTRMKILCPFAAKSVEAIVACSKGIVPSSSHKGENPCAPSPISR